MFERIAIGCAIVIAILCGVSFFQYKHIQSMNVKMSIQSSQITGLQNQRKEDQENINTAMIQIAKAQKERNEIAKKLSALQDKQSLDWLHANIPDGVRSILMPTKPTPDHQATMQ